jgi:hypothetical protein
MTPREAANPSPTGLVDEPLGNCLTAAGAVQSRTGILLRNPWVSFEEQMEVFQTSLSSIPLLRIAGDVDQHSAPELEAVARKEAG